MVLLFQIGVSLGQAATYTCDFKYESSKYGNVHITYSASNRQEAINKTAEQCFELLRASNQSQDAEDLLLECANRVPEKC